MKVNSIKIMGLALLCGSMMPGAFAASGSSAFVFIENNVDDSYFVAPIGSTSGMIAGSNRWMYLKGGAPNGWTIGQKYLGYLGFPGNGLNTDEYFDMWLGDNAPVQNPFSGLACDIKAQGCGADSGMVAPALTDKRGFYKVKTPGAGASSSFGVRGKLSPSFFEFLKTLKAGDIFPLSVNWCKTTEDYNPITGGRCSDTGSTITSDMQYTKAGHVKLIMSNTTSQILVDSNGNPTIQSGTNCVIGVSGSIGDMYNNGVACKMSEIELNLFGSVGTNIQFKLEPNSSVLNFTPASNDLLFSPDGKTWKSMSNAFNLSDLSNAGSNDRGLYIFFTKSFLKQSVTNNFALSNLGEAFRGIITESLTSNSGVGWYAFSFSNGLIVKPETLSVSIVSSDGQKYPHREGIVGDGESPIKFDYTVTTTGKTLADQVLIKVTGDNVNISGQDYCQFASADGSIKVPFKSYITYTKDNGVEQSYYHDCKGEWVDITKALWVLRPLNASKSTNVNTTDVSLLFPMDNVESKRTVTGQVWEGRVNASGQITVQATWNTP